MLWSAAWRLSELKALEASTHSTPSTPGHSPNAFRTAWTPISHAEGTPTHSWAGATAFMTSNSISSAIARQMMRRNTSPIAMGRTPGRLSRAINLPARNASRWLGWISCVHNRTAIRESALHKLPDAPLYTESIRFQPSESMPESPAAPDIRMATFLIFAGVIAWNRTAWGLWSSLFSSTSIVGVVAGGCFSRSTSNTVLSPTTCWAPRTALGPFVR